MHQVHTTQLRGMSLEEVRERYQQATLEKPILKEIDADWFEAVIAMLLPGRTLQIGAGNGAFKAHYPGVISADVARTPWIDMVADATEMPFGNDELQNIILIDGFWKLAEPAALFRESYRVLRPGGRLILVESRVSRLSQLLYRLFHGSAVTLNPVFQPERKRHMGGIPGATFPMSLLASEYSHHPRLLTGFKPIHRASGELFAYYLTGGLDHAAWLPEGILRRVRRMESKLAFLKPLMASRLICVLEKQGGFY